MCGFRKTTVTWGSAWTRSPTAAGTLDSRQSGIQPELVSRPSNQVQSDVVKGSTNLQNYWAYLNVSCFAPHTHTRTFPQPLTHSLKCGYQPKYWVSHSQFLSVVEKTGHMAFSPNQMGDFTDTVQSQHWKQALSHPGTAVSRVSSPLMPELCRAAFIWVRSTRPEPLSSHFKLLMCGLHSMNTPYI